MTDYPPSAWAMLTEFFTTETIEQTARRTGFVKRTAKITGTILLAVVTFGRWSARHTTLAQLATTVTQFGTQPEVSAEAIHQRLNAHAVIVLQAMIRPA